MRRLRSLLALAVNGCVPHAPRPVDDLLGPFPVVIGHRGAAADAPENTLAAFRRARDLGVPLELDVTATADGVVVVLHDDHLDRTTTGSGFVDEQRWADIQGVDAGAWFSPDFAGEPLPTLDRAFDEIAGEVVVNIEIKSPRDGSRASWLAGLVVDCVERHGMSQRVFVTSFNPYVLAAVRARAPALPRGQLYGTFRGADLPWIQKVALRNLALNGKAVPDMLVVESAFLRPRYVRRMKRTGYRVLAWTVNDPDEIRRLLDMGVDGIISDRPAEARAVVRAHVAAR
jgi:glycerophosphoryl diester phosphodiesterase